MGAQPYPPPMRGTPVYRAVLRSLLYARSLRLPRFPFRAAGQWKICPRQRMPVAPQQAVPPKCTAARRDGRCIRIPKEFIPHIPSSIQNSSVTIPKGPRRPPANIYRMRSTVIGSYSDGTTKVQIAVIAATMTTGVPTMPALTAASPTMSAATRLTEWPMGLGRRSPASRTISSEN